MLTDTVRGPVGGVKIRPDDVIAIEVHAGQTLCFRRESRRHAFVNDPHQYGPVSNDIDAARPVQ